MVPLLAAACELAFSVVRILNSRQESEIRLRPSSRDDSDKSRSVLYSEAQMAAKNQAELHRVRFRKGFEFPTGTGNLARMSIGRKIHAFSTKSTRTFDFYHTR